MVSVIVPVFNGERYLRDAVESAITQTLAPLEVIIVDDGSTDSTAELANVLVAEAAEVRIRYESKPNAGGAAARNRGVELAAGNLLAFLDADDLWTPEKLASQIVALEKFRAGMQRSAIWCNSSVLSSMRKRLSLRCPPNAIPGYTHCTMLIRRDAFMRVGMFDTEWQLGEFVAWYLKALENDLASVMLPDVVLRRRLHDRNQGVSKRDFHKDYVRIVKASLDRRRQKGARA
jgi:Glycosyltransferases involved in cell wall biogenesis